MTRKTILFILVLVIGGGALAASMMFQPQEQTNSNASPEAAKVVVDNSGAEFLNYDIIVGDKNAPVEIIEYAAISCSHCAHFHETVYPELKKKYLDTGKAKLVYRNFIFDNPFDVFAATLSRCVSEAEFLPTMETYFNKQKVWNNIPELRRIFEAEGREAAVKYAQSEVAKIGKDAGISDEKASQCFGNENVIKYLLQVRQEAVEKYDVQSTPTVIVNGKKLDHNDFNSIEKAIAATEK